ncbi:MAG: RNA polymerase sigma-70 factor [Ferruginibacter sp.]|nr:RNA polymerase sigma-70 factor [Cytophagales bacterium]
MTILLHKLSDEQLLEILREGNDQAFDHLYDRYRDKLYTIALNRTRSREVAEELTQDTLADLWEKRRFILINGHVSAYLGTALKYAVLDYFRNQRVKDRFVQAILSAPPDGSPTADQETTYRELEDGIQQEISRLPEKCRQVFRLSRQEYRSVKEIARQLDVSPNTVKYHLAFALRTLRTNLKHFLAPLLPILISLLGHLR